MTADLSPLKQRIGQINALINHLRPRTKLPGAKFDLAVRLAITATLLQSGDRDRALVLLDISDEDAKKAGVKKRVDEIFSAEIAAPSVIKGI